MFDVFYVDFLKDFRQNSSISTGIDYRVKLNCSKTGARGRLAAVILCCAHHSHVIILFPFPSMYSKKLSFFHILIYILIFQVQRYTTKFTPLMLLDWCLTRLSQMV